MSEAAIQPEPAPTPQSRPHPLRKSIITLVKLIIAVAGIWLVYLSMTWNDTATLPANGQAINTLTFVEDTPVTVVSQHTTGNKDIVRIRFPKAPVKVSTETATGERTFEIVIQEGAVIPGTNETLQLAREMEIDTARLKEEKGQRVHQGMRTLLIEASAKWYLLVLAWALLGIPFLVTAVRWRDLMRPQGINMPLSKCMQLTFVGQFYSIMLPGITGGDLVKIVYAARLTGSKTKSFITIILDRVVGLVALMVIAATSAGIQLILNYQRNQPLDTTLFNVFLMIAAMLAVLAVGTTVYFSRRLRRLTGITWFIENSNQLTSSAEGSTGEEAQHQKLEGLFRMMNGTLLAIALVLAAFIGFLLTRDTPWVHKNQIFLRIGVGLLLVVALGATGGLLLHRMLVSRTTPVMRRVIGVVVRVDETLHVYRGHFGLLFWAFGISLFSQLTLPISAWLSGQALGMHASIGYYLAYVPLGLIASSLPISPPQGFGVLDGIFYHFFAERGSATASQAVALAQAVRFLPLMWNLIGAYWVITGKYSRHQMKLESKELSEASAGK